MRRDLFLFDAPPPPSRARGEATVVLDPAPTAPPEDPRISAARASAPADLRYLGFLKGAPTGLIGAFMRGEEPLTLAAGATLNGWRLIEVVEGAATFRHLDLPALTLTLRAKEAS
jgi:hypothetical protein